MVGGSVRVGEDGGRLFEGSDQVFALGQVYADFGPDAGINHCQQAGGALDETDATQIGGGDKTGHVAYNPAS